MAEGYQNEVLGTAEGGQHKVADDDTQTRIFQAAVYTFSFAINDNDTAQEAFDQITYDDTQTHSERLYAIESLFKKWFYESPQYLIERFANASSGTHFGTDLTKWTRAILSQYERVVKQSHQ